MPHRTADVYVQRAGCLALNKGRIANTATGDLYMYRTCIYF